MNKKARLPGEAKSFNVEKKQALRMAKDLYYGNTIIELIQSATSSVQITNALRMGRMERLG